MDFLEHFENEIPVLQNEEENSDNVVHKFKCSICSKAFKLKRYLKSHIQSVHEKKRPFICPTCSKTFKQKNTLNQHIALVHEGKRPHKCDICNANLYSKRSLRTHTLAHLKQEIPQKCKFCGTIFSNDEALKAHITVVHEGKTLMPSPVEPYFICTHCDERFEKRINLESHLKRVHAIKKNLKCTSQNNSQILHETPTQQSENNHSDKFLNCSTCDAPFTSKKALKFHIKKEHEGGQKCSPKNTYSISQENLEQIIKTDNSIITLQNEDSSQVHERKKPFVCQTCAADFQQKRYLLTHIKAVHDEKKHYCTICNKGFAIKGWLKTHHSRVHEKKAYKKAHKQANKQAHKQVYKCSLCDFEFTKKTQLNTHVAFGHDKEKKTFQCTACDYSSSNQSQYIEVAQGGVSSNTHF